MPLTHFTLPHFGREWKCFLYHFSQYLRWVNCVFLLYRNCSLACLSFSAAEFRCSRFSSVCCLLLKTIDLQQAGSHTVSIWHSGIVGFPFYAFNLAFQSPAFNILDPQLAFRAKPPQETEEKKVWFVCTVHTAFHFYWTWKVNLATQVQLSSRIQIYVNLQCLYVRGLG